MLTGILVTKWTPPSTNTPVVIYWKVGRPTSSLLSVHHPLPSCTSNTNGEWNCATSKDSDLDNFNSSTSPSYPSHFLGNFPCNSKHQSQSSIHQIFRWLYGSILHQPLVDMCIISDFQGLTCLIFTFPIPFGFSSLPTLSCFSILKIPYALLLPSLSFPHYQSPTIVD